MKDLHVHVAPYQFIPKKDLDSYQGTLNGSKIMHDRVHFAAIWTEQSAIYPIDRRLPSVVSDKPDWLQEAK